MNVQKCAFYNSVQGPSFVEGLKNGPSLSDFRRLYQK